MSTSDDHTNIKSSYTAIATVPYIVISDITISYQAYQNVTKIAA